MKLRSDRKPPWKQCENSIASRGAGMSDKKDIVWGLRLLLSGLLCLSVTRQSLWIDEGGTAWLASQPELGSLFRTVGGLSTSEAQMPLYTINFWAWANLLGTGALALHNYR